MQRESDTPNGSISKLFSHVPAKEFVFITQILIIFIVLITCVVNLSLEQGEASLWKYLLCSIVGYVLPNPSLKQRSNV